MAAHGTQGARGKITEKVGGEREVLQAGASSKKAPGIIVEEKKSFLSRLIRTFLHFALSLSLYFYINCAQKESFKRE